MTPWKQKRQAEARGLGQSVRLMAVEFSRDARNGVAFEVDSANPSPIRRIMSRLVPILRGLMR